ncbi:MAG: DUF952 domain-containing protein [Acidimicrobiia bacterium]|nr:DUF952 domain-containing protein [Acidimicrobiia bacterium]
MSISNSNSDDAGPARVLHITDGQNYWRQRSAGAPGFVDPSLDSEGFIHCSTADQFLIPANERFQGRNGLVLLVIDAGRLSAPLVYEDCCRSGQTFPHVYGPIDFDAVVGVIDFPPGPEGRFDEPDDLRTSLGRFES